uniref:Uncharacterized protein n=1 Tax=Lotharella globosa TaxID=91324 RepID=A0A7S4DWC8_9EUKA
MHIFKLSDSAFATTDRFRAVHDDTFIILYGIPLLPPERASQHQLPTRHPPENIAMERVKAPQWLMQARRCVSCAERLGGISVARTIGCLSKTSRHQEVAQCNEIKDVMSTKDSDRE